MKMIPILKSDLRKQIRIKHYDYRLPNYYHVVVNTKNGRFYLGDVREKQMILSAVGKIVEDCWKKIPEHFDNVELDVFQVMPNHIHGIIHMISGFPVGVHNCEPHGAHSCVPLQNVIKISEGQNEFQHTLPKSISTIVRSFKTVVKTWCNQNNHEYFEWQRNFYEHVIRAEKELFYQRQYILNNPLKWHLDKNNPNRKPGKYYFEY